MKFEQSAILELCKFINPDKEKIKFLFKKRLNFPWILGQILFNRMGATAYYTLKKCDLLGEVNREFRNTLKDAYHSGIDKNSNFQSNLEEVKKILSKISAPYAILKGGVLSYIYPEGLRNSNDIDILTEQVNVPIISDVLRKNGFIQGHIRNDSVEAASRFELINSMMNRGETVPFVKSVSDHKYPFIEVDLNFSLDYKPVGSDEIIKLMLENTYIHDVTGFKVLSKADFMIHLCLHLYKEATTLAWVDMNRDLSIYKFCDIYLLLHQWLNPDYHNVIRDRIDEFNLNKECYYSLYYTKILFDIKSKELDSLLLDIRPKNTTYLREIISPGDSKTYKYDKNFLEWIFTYNRKELLYDTRLQ